MTTDDKYTDEERASAERIGTTPEDLDLAFAAAGERPELDASIEAYAVARSQREMVSDQEKRLREIEGRAEAALFEALERLGLRSVRHRTLGLFTLNDMANAVVIDEAALREWAQEEMPELLLPNRARLGKVVRDTMKEGGELPPGTDVSFYRKINWRRGTV
jgi:hypothetical protein